MWYVMQVRAGTEESMREKCQKMIPDTILERCFTPYYEEERRIQKVWRTRKRILFPGYLFIVTEEIQEVYQYLNQIAGTAKILKAADMPMPLDREEADMLAVFGGEEQIIRMSRGVIENQQLKILTGPLIGKEQYICKIDRHKRKAWLAISIFGSTQIVQVGLEITKKT